MNDVRALLPASGSDLRAVREAKTSIFFTATYNKRSIYSMSKVHGDAKFRSVQVSKSKIVAQYCDLRCFSVFQKAGVGKLTYQN